MAPTLRFSDEMHQMKYRFPMESFNDSARRQAHALSDQLLPFDDLYNSIYNQELLLGGRVQAAIGTGKDVTPYNCFVSRTIHDSMDSILAALNEAVYTMRLGGGIGYDFSNLRPAGWTIKSLGSHASGPISFMGMFDAACDTIKSAGHRRGAMMGCLRVDHPDIRSFIYAKQNNDKLTNFNLSVLVTDEFMQAIEDGDEFPLTFDGYITEWVDAQTLWDEITAMTWDWAEPGVIFVDRLNDWNNLWYCEQMNATNPCAEQPLPPYGACLLGSLNLVKFLIWDPHDEAYRFDWMHFNRVTRMSVRALENVIDNAHYPLEEQRREAREKRRMGLGITGLANTVEALGMQYGTSEAVDWVEQLGYEMAHAAYGESVELAKERGPFPLYDERYLRSRFVRERLDPELQFAIQKWGIRNSHLLSIAPTGTISLCADNVSSGIEPPYDYGYPRPVNTPSGVVQEFIADYGYKHLGVRGRTTEDLTVDEHLAMLVTAQKWMDSSVSKTVNVGSLVTFPQFKDIYRKAYYGGAKSCSTFRKDGKRWALLDPGTACEVDPESGKQECE
jgi:ribonucleoside-diphosphate reductase alpha chain